MANPLDYFGDRPAPQPPSGSKLPIASRVAPPPPPEFASIAAETTDHAAAIAIQTALRKASIPFHLTHDNARTNRLVRVMVRPADHARAADIANAILSRRSRVRSLPRQEMPTDTPPAHNWDWDINFGD